MASIVLKLKKVSHNGWQLFAPKGHTIGPVFTGSDLAYIRRSAKIFVSSWYNWVVDDSDCYSEGEIKHEFEKDRILRKSF